MAQDPLAAIGGIPAASTTQQDPLAAIGGIPDTTSTSATPALTADQKFNQPFQPAPKEPVAPPRDHKEELVQSVGGDHGLAAYRAARKAVEGVEMMIKAPAESYDAAKEVVKNLGTDMISNVKANMTELDPNKGQMYAAPITPMPGVTSAAGAFADSEAAAGRGAAAAPTVAAAPTKPLIQNPFKKLLQSPKEAGIAATQEPGAAAVRTATGAAAGTPILAGTETAADEALAKVGVAKDAAYKQIDDTVGFDLKAERQKLSDTQYAIKQPGADVPKLQAEMDASAQRIADANAKLAKAGIDPKVADKLNTSWEATKQFKNDLVKSTASDGTINVKTLLNRSKNARFNPRYGDRLAQSFGQGDAVAGKKIADAYIQGLEAAQKAGVQAVKAQKIKQWITGLSATAAIGTGATAGIKLLLEP